MATTHSTQHGLQSVASLCPAMPIFPVLESAPKYAATDFESNRWNKQHNLRGHMEAIT